MNYFRIRHMKSFVDSGDIEIRPITIFVGKNSCGKSSLLRFPAVLSQTLDEEINAPLKLYGKFVDYGNYEDVIHHGSNRDISFDVGVNVDLDPKAFIIPIHRGEKGKRLQLLPKGTLRNRDIHECRLSVEIRATSHQMVLSKLEVYIDENLFYLITNTDKNNYLFEVLSVYREGQLVDEYHYFELPIDEFKEFFPIYDEVERFKKVYCSYKNGVELSDDYFLEQYHNYHNEDDTYNYLSSDISKTLMALDYAGDILRKIRSQLCASLMDLRYVGPFREPPQRLYRDLEYNVDEVGVRGQHLSNYLFSSFHSPDKNFEEISLAVREILGYELKIKKIQSGYFQIAMVDKFGQEVNLIDTGFGISQVLPVIVQLLSEEYFDDDDDTDFEPFETVTYSTKNYLLIEQPELHLHPAAQAEMAKLFVKYVQCDEDNRLLVETHSEHLIRKLQVLIASKDCPITNDMVKVYYVDLDDDGDAKVTDMKILPNGKFEKKWPSGFFDKGYQLSVELANAGV